MDVTTTAPSSPRQALALPEANRIQPCRGQASSRTGRAAVRMALLVAMAVALSGCSFLNTSSVDGPSGSRRSSSKVVETARSQIGKPYRAAGDTPSKGFDCSGLVQWAYAQNGIGLPRKSTDQYQVGKSVSKGALTPGDLVFFKLGKRSSSLHVGIYAGGGEFIHSPSTGGRVREERLADSYWTDVYLGAKRVGE